MFGAVSKLIMAAKMRAELVSENPIRRAFSVKWLLFRQMCKAMSSRKQP